MKSRPKHYKVKRLRVWKFAGEHNSKWRLKEYVKKSDIMTYLEGVEALVEDLIGTPHLLRFEDISTRAILGKKFSVNGQVGITGLVVEGGHLDAAKPHCDGIIVG